MLYTFAENGVHRLTGLQGLLLLHLPHIHDVSQQDVIDSRFRMLEDAFNFWQKYKSVTKL